MNRTVLTSARQRRIAQILFVLNAAIWLAFSGVTLLRMGGGPEQRVSMGVVALLMLGNAGAMLFGAWGLSTGKRLLYWAAVALIAVNIILTFTDQFGMLDLLTLLLDLILLALLIAIGLRTTHQVGRK